MSRGFHQQLHSPNAITDDRTTSYFAQTSPSYYRAPRILSMSPAQGQEGQTFHLILDNLDPSLDVNLLRIAFHNCSTTCQISFDNVTQAVTMTTTVPPPNLIATDDLSRIPIHLEVVVFDANSQHQQNRVVMRWFVGYFAFYPANAAMTASTRTGISRKRGSGDDSVNNEGNRNMSYESNMKRFRQEEHAQEQTTYISQPFSATYYQFLPQQQTAYMGLPPAQPSHRSREYFEESALYNYVPPNSSSSNFTSPYSNQDYVSQPHIMQPQQQQAAPQPPPQQLPNQSPYLMQMMDPALPHSPQSFSPSLNSPSISSPNTHLPTIAQPTFQMRPSVYQLSSPQPQPQQTSPYTLMPSSSYPAPSPSAHSASQHTQQPLQQHPPSLTLPPSTQSPALKSAAPISSSHRQQTASSTNASTSSAPTTTESQRRALPEDYISTFKTGANLVLHGDLKDMLRDWTATEQRERRRLVQFNKTRRGNTIDCWFQPHSLSSSPPQFQLYGRDKVEEGGDEASAAIEGFTTTMAADSATTSPQQRYKPDSKDIVVSCIYWEAKNDYFVTSVDCIQLLEALVDGRFTVEEKNRVRRNLENYKPLTVSKMNPNTNEFFRLIMGYPNPKPRNIEKDVKVFQWLSLGTAIEKVLKKFSASFSSIQSVNYEEFMNSVTNDKPNDAGPGKQ